MQKKNSSEWVSKKVRLNQVTVNFKMNMSLTFFAAHSLSHSLSRSVHASVCLFGCVRDRRCAGGVTSCTGAKHCCIFICCRRTHRDINRERAVRCTYSDDISIYTFLCSFFEWFFALYVRDERLSKLLTVQCFVSYVCNFYDGLIFLRNYKKILEQIRQINELSVKANHERRK